VKLSTGDAKETLPFSPDYTYADLKSIIEKVLSNHELMSKSPFEILMPIGFPVG
jgi:hypothetical protein